VNSPQSVLIVAAEKELRRALRAWFAKRGFDVQEASNLDEAIAAIFDVPDTSAIICDERLPDGGALNLLHWLREQLFAASFLMITGRPGQSSASTPKFEAIEVPVTGKKLEDLLERVLPPRVRLNRQTAAKRKSRSTKKR
jgi:DNA-binding NtrC family response regulator